MSQHDALASVVAISAVTLSNAAASAPFVVPGPELAIVLGVKVPLLSAIFAVGGVGLGQLLAPSAASTLDLRRRIALFVALTGLALGIVIASGQMPLVALSWGIGLGFSGLTVAQTLGAQAVSGIKRVTDAAIGAMATRLGGANPSDPAPEAAPHPQEASDHE